MEMIEDHNQEWQPLLQCDKTGKKITNSPICEVFIEVNNPFYQRIR